jgi:hypothetical protein
VDTDRFAHYRHELVNRELWAVPPVTSSFDIRCSTFDILRLSLTNSTRSSPLSFIPDSTAPQTSKAPFPRSGEGDGREAPGTRSQLEPTRIVDFIKPAILPNSFTPINELDRTHPIEPSPCHFPVIPPEALCNGNLRSPAASPHKNCTLDQVRTSRSPHLRSPPRPPDNLKDSIMDRGPKLPAQPADPQPIRRP